MRIGAIVLAGGMLLGSATGAAALERRNEDARVGANRQNDTGKDAKREFRQRIQAKQREYRQLRRADDPRSEQVRQEITALKAEWTRLYGNDEQRTERRHGKSEKVKKQHAKKPHGKRNH